MTLGTQTQPHGKLLDYEQFIDHQLARTRTRIKMTDIFTAVLILLVGLLGDAARSRSCSTTPSACPSACARFIFCYR